MYYLLHRKLEQAGYGRVSVWSFAKPGVTPFSSVTRSNYVGLGPGAVTHVRRSIHVNTFDLSEYLEALLVDQCLPISQTASMSGKMEQLIWTYWRLYQTEVSLEDFRREFETGPRWEVRLFLALARLLGTERTDRRKSIRLNVRSAHFIHLLQNHLVLAEVSRHWDKQINMGSCG